MRNDEKKRCLIKKRRVRMSLLLSAAVLSILFCLSPERTFADGEIFLYRGDTYSLACLMSLREDQEYEIFIENPDIVGLGENGKEIVAVAEGTSEVTVSISNPGAAYSYVFVVGEYDRPVQEEFVEYGPVEDEEYDATQEDRNQHNSSDGREDFTEDEMISEREPDASEERSVSEMSQDTSGDRSVPESDPDTSEVRIVSERDPDTFGESESFSDPEDDLSGAGDTEETESSGEKGGRQVIDAPIYFAHGQGLYDLAVPKGYTLWISATGKGRMAVLYVGFGGVPVPYHIKGRMIFIHSDDLKQGSGTIQVVAANEAGSVYTMSDYKVCIS